MTRKIEETQAAMLDRLDRIEDALDAQGLWPDDPEDQADDDQDVTTTIVPDELGSWYTIVGPDGAEHRANGRAAAEALAAEIGGAA